MSDTPRTDAQKRGDFVHINFARELERENAALQADKERLDWLDADCEVIILTAKGGYELIGHNAFFAVEQKGTLRAAIDAARKEAQL